MNRIRKKNPARFPVNFRITVATQEPLIIPFKLGPELKARAGKPSHLTYEKGMAIETSVYSRSHGTEVEIRLNHDGYAIGHQTYSYDLHGQLAHAYITRVKGRRLTTYVFARNGNKLVLKDTQRL